MFRPDPIGLIRKTMQKDASCISLQLRVSFHWLGSHPYSSITALL